MHTEEIKDKFIQLRAKGMSLRTIGKELDISKSIAWKWAAQFETEIENLRAFEHQAIQEQYFASYEREISILAEETNRVYEVLRGRDYGYVPTPQLWNQFSALLARIDKKRINPKFTKPNEPEPAQPSTPAQPETPPQP